MWTYDQGANDEDVRAYNICVTLADTCQFLNDNVCPCIDVLEGLGSYDPFSPNLNPPLHHIVYVSSECRLDHIQTVQTVHVHNLSQLIYKDRTVHMAVGWSDYFLEYFL